MPQQFLVIRLSSIGDIVHALPAVAALSETFRSAEITWIIEARYVGILSGNPCVHHIQVLDTLGWRSHGPSFRALRQARHALTALRGLACTAAIDFQGLIKSAAIGWLSRAPCRIGFEREWLREPLARFFYTDRVSARGRRHVIEANMALVQRLGAQQRAPGEWQFPLPADDRATAVVEERLRQLGAEKFAIVNPGGGWITKRWPAASYARLIAECARAGIMRECKILLTGSPDEESTIQEILKQANTSRAAYFPSSLLEFMALVRRARLFVGGDTGPLHIAAALRVPIVAIYGPTSAARNGPFCEHDVVLASGARTDHSRRGRDARFLEGVSVASVMEAIRQRLTSAYG